MVTADQSYNPLNSINLSSDTVYPCRIKLQIV